MRPLLVADEDKLNFHTTSTNPLKNADSSLASLSSSNEGRVANWTVTSHVTYDVYCRKIPTHPFNFKSGMHVVCLCTLYVKYLIRKKTTFQ